MKLHRIALVCLLIPPFSAPIYGRALGHLLFSLIPLHPKFFSPRHFFQAHKTLEEKQRQRIASEPQLLFRVPSSVL